ncbi:MAG: 3'-5' exonuclease [Arcobacteraceae bacterium]|jgi:DNA polymerase III epsilon subunit-like protein|nr:3'-5' exonuclease [Arcobacteraceae bacterium]
MSKYMLFDTETTGAMPEDRIIQVGGILLNSSEKPLVFDELCSSEIDIKIEAMEVHNITPSMIENKAPFIKSEFYRVLQEINNSQNYLIAHNISFDLGMLEKEGFKVQMQLIDTLRCARHLLDDMPYHRLQYLRYALDLYKIEEDEAAKLGITIKAHDAIGDVLVMKLLLSKLTQIAKEKYSLSGIDAVNKLVELTNTPVFVKILKFGKHKDKSLEDIALSDRGYLNWLLSTDLDEDLEYSIKRVLA